MSENRSSTPRETLTPLGEALQRARELVEWAEQSGPVDGVDRNDVPEMVAVRDNTLLVCREFLALYALSETKDNAAPQEVEAGRAKAITSEAPAVAAPRVETVPIEKARERIAGIEEYLARQKTTSVKEEQAHLVEGSDASLYWHFGYMMALKDIFRLSGKQQDQDGKLFQ